MYSGIKFIPMRTPGGELIPGSGLFVRIKKAAATSSDFSLEDGNTDAAKTEEESKKNNEVESGDNEEVKVDDKGQKVSQIRRFSSPARFECLTDVSTSTQLTVIAEMCADTTEPNMTTEDSHL